MELTGNQKLLILTVLIVGVLYLIYSQKSGKHTQKHEKYTGEDFDNSVESFDNSVESVIHDSDEDNNFTESFDESVNSFAESVCLDGVTAELTGSNNSSEDESCDSDSEDKINFVQDPELDKESVKKMLDKKMKNTHNPSSNSYKKSSYACNKRDQVGTQNLDDFFELGNPFNENGNNNFYGNDEGNNLAAYAGCSSKKISEEEKFNSSALLPKEQNNDWFDTCADTTKSLKSKNRHLININRPIGVTTISTQRKNPSYDVRGNPANPKYVISPFLNSSYEPDINSSGICI